MALSRRDFLGLLSAFVAANLIPRDAAALGIEVRELGSVQGGGAVLVIGGIEVPAGATVVVVAHEEGAEGPGMVSDSRRNPYSLLMSQVIQGQGSASLYYSTTVERPGSIAFTKEKRGSHAAVSALCLTGVAGLDQR